MAVLKNVLNRKEIRALEDLIIQHKEEILAGKWTHPAFASFASKRLNRPVTPPNVAKASKTMDVQFPRGSGQVALKSTKELRAAVKLLSTALVRLYGEVGTTPPPELVLLGQQEVENGNS